MRWAQIPYRSRADKHNSRDRHRIGFFGPPACAVGNGPLPQEDGGAFSTVLESRAVLGIR